MTGLCRDCDLVHADTRKRDPYKWRCVKFPKPNVADERLKFIAPDWTPDPPYKLCLTIMADGGCEGSFVPRREGPKGDTQ